MEKNEVEYWVKQIAARACVWLKQCGTGLCVRDKQCGTQRVNAISNILPLIKRALYRLPPEQVSAS